MSYFVRVTLCMMIVSLAGKWLFVTIIRMETVENDFDIPRRCYLTLSLGDDCVTQYGWNDVSLDTDTPPFPRLECEPTVLTSDA